MTTTSDKIPSGKEGADVAVGKTRSGRIVVTWDCQPETMSGYQFKQTQRVLFSVGEAEFLFEELKRILGHR